mmetsp:Transcript_17253/g.42996  ORF Transcript_17253/g.42996 Transcript_17253/m.42996 type:complete len:83 (+) Transcript_17253:345-593(+)
MRCSDCYSSLLAKLGPLQLRYFTLCCVHVGFVHSTLAPFLETTIAFHFSPGTWRPPWPSIRLLLFTVTHCCTLYTCPIYAEW